MPRSELVSDIILNVRYTLLHVVRCSLVDEQLALFDKYSSSLSSWCDEHCDGDITELPSLGVYVAIKNPVFPRGWFRAVVNSHLNR